MNALPLLAQTVNRTVFEFGRIQDDSDWVLPLLVLAGIVAFVITMYRRDTQELGAIVSSWLVALRVLAFLGLFFIYLQPQWRNETQKTLPSRVVLLVDTSLSMETNDNDSSPSEPTRAQRVMALLEEGKLIDDLRRIHDVALWRFDRDTTQLATLPRLPRDSSDSPENPLLHDSPASTDVSNPKTDWQEVLAPRGAETRLGEGLRTTLSEERGTPLAGIVVITDGQQNTGVEPQVAVGMAAEMGVPLYPVGVGTDRQPANVRVSRIEAPARAYPGDAYSVTGYFQAQGMGGKSLNVELLSRPDGAGSEESSLHLEASEQIVLGTDGEETSVKFEVKPGGVGRRMLVLRVVAPPEDRNREDNQREATVEVVDRKTKVLLFAGAASREYQFLRNVLRRDKEVVVDVLLQTGHEGISQDAHKILEDFPTSREDMFTYDCVVAVDPDWRELDAKQIDLLDAWVDDSGGLIVIAGPINTDTWAQSAAMTKIRTLYPVEFNRRFAIVEDGRYGSEEPQPLTFDRAGVEAEFLWLADNPVSSTTAWSDFPGVYGYYDVRGAKPGAQVYARFGRPGLGSEAPVYFAGQYCGAGQVFYLGSGEMWRLRSLSEAYFETFYTKLIRHVSQGRFLRGSNRGALFTEREQYLPGNSVEVRAKLKNAQFEPLADSQVQAQVIGPDGRVTGLALTSDPSRPGAYRGQLTVRKEGSYRFELPLADSDEILTCPPIQVTIPNLERDHTQRNDTLLNEVARQTGGVYYVGFEELLDGKGNDKAPLATALRDASRTLTLAATPDRLWDNYWMLAIICSLLCMEWLTRRLVKLA